jgi:hypothetical protein
MAESIALTTPYTVDPRQASSFVVDSILLNWKEKSIVIHLGGNGIQQRIEYTGTVATNLMIALNKANLSTTSLQKRIFLQLIADGYIAGSITGTPD